MRSCPGYSSEKGRYAGHRITAPESGESTLLQACFAQCLQCPDRLLTGSAGKRRIASAEVADQPVTLVMEEDGALFPENTLLVRDLQIRLRIGEKCAGADMGHLYALLAEIALQPVHMGAHLPERIAEALVMKVAVAQIFALGELRVGGIAGDQPLAVFDLYNGDAGRCDDNQVGFCLPALIGDPQIGKNVAVISQFFQQRQGSPLAIQTGLENALLVPGAAFAGEKQAENPDEGIQTEAGRKQQENQLEKGREVMEGMGCHIAVEDAADHQCDGEENQGTGAVFPPGVFQLDGQIIPGGVDLCHKGTSLFKKMGIVPLYTFSTESTRKYRKEKKGRLLPPLMKRLWIFCPGY